MRAEIKSLATYVPPRLLTNADLEKLVETSNEWIMQRTGIRERRVVTEDMATSDLAVGDVVYVMPYLSCGTCIACRQGKTNCCTRIQVLGVHCDGAFTQYLSVPQAFVHKAVSSRATLEG